MITVAQSIAMYLYFSYQVSISELSVGEYTILLGTSTLLVTTLLGFFKAISSIRRTLGFTHLFSGYRGFVEIHSDISSSRLLPRQKIADMTIKFENVSFAYPESEIQVFENISFEIAPGEKIGIVGLNGSGKTTLIKLLCRLYEPTSGRILLNDRNISEIPLDKYYRIIGSVFQDCQLFAFTLTENLTLSETSDRERIYMILRELGLERFAENLPEGFDTYLTRQFSSSGVELSGGQEQKLAIARALYKDAPLLILDEPTTSLDPKAESEIYSDFNRMARDKTTIFISHRLAAAAIVDRIALLDGGHIAEEGEHNELVTLGGLYAQMYQPQEQLYNSCECSKSTGYASNSNCIMLTLIYYN